MPKETLTNWECECGFPYNFMDMTECDECGKPKPKDAPTSEHKVIGEASATSVTLD